MKRLAGRQTRYANKLERRTGSLWDGRYKVSPIQQDEYLLACCRYVELNPVRAGMVDRPEHYRWSSYRSKISGVPGWIDCDACFQGLSDSPKKRVIAYAKFVNGAVSADCDSLIQLALQRNQLTGGKKFIDEIEARMGARIEFRGGGRPRVRDKINLSPFCTV